MYGVQIKETQSPMKDVHPLAPPMIWLVRALEVYTLQHAGYSNSQQVLRHVCSVCIVSLLYVCLLVFGSPSVISCLILFHFLVVWYLADQSVNNTFVTRPATSAVPWYSGAKDITMCIFCYICNDNFYCSQS